MSMIDILVRANDQASATLNRVGNAGTTMGTRLEAAGARVSAAGARLSTVGSNLTRKVTLPIVGLGAAAVKSFASFDDAMTQSLAIMSNVSDRMRARMEATARTVATTTTFSATEAAEAYFFLASAGLDAAASVEAMPRVAQFAQAGMFDMARATDLLTDAQSALGLTIRDDAVANMQNLVRVSDVLVKANTLANASVEQFSESLTNKAAAALKNLNKDIEEGVAVLAAFADQGVKGTLAGNALAIVLRDLQTAARKNSGEWKDLGVAVFDSEGNMRSIGDIVADLEGLLEGMTDRQKAATLAQLGFQDRSKSFLLTLLGTSDAIKGYERDLRSAGGTTQEVADKQLTSFSARMKIVKDRIIDVGIALGQQLAPQLEKAGEFVTRLVEKFGTLSPAMQENVLKIAAAAAAAGPLLIVVGKLAQAIGFLAANPIVLAIAALAALAAWWLSNEENMEKFRGAIEALVEWVQSNFGPQIEQIMQSVSEILDAARKFWARWGDQITRIVKVAAKFWATTIGNALAAILGVIQTVLAVITGDWSAAWDGIRAVVRAVWSQIRNVVGTAIRAMKELIRTVLHAIGETWGNVWDNLKGAVGAAWDGIVSAAKAGLNALITVLNALIRAINTTAEAMANISAGPFAGVVNVPDIPPIPGLAHGGRVARRGLAIVGERGPELLALPGGADVVPLGGVGAAVAAPVVNVYLTTDHEGLADAIVRALREGEPVHVPVAWADDVGARAEAYLGRRVALRRSQ